MPQTFPACAVFLKFHNNTISVLSFLTCTLLFFCTNSLRVFWSMILHDDPRSMRTPSRMTPPTCKSTVCDPLLSDDLPSSAVKAYSSSSSSTQLTFPHPHYFHDIVFFFFFSCLLFVLQTEANCSVIQDFVQVLDLARQCLSCAKCPPCLHW